MDKSFLSICTKKISIKLIIILKADADHASSPGDQISVPHFIILLGTGRKVLSHSVVQV